MINVVVVLGQISIVNVSKEPFTSLEEVDRRNALIRKVREEDVGYILILFQTTRSNVMSISVPLRCEAAEKAYLESLNDTERSSEIAKILAEVDARRTEFVKQSKGRKVIDFEDH